MGMVVRWMLLPTMVASLLSQSHMEQITRGKVVEIPNFLPADDLAALRSDAQGLFDEGKFVADGLAVYGKKSAQFDPTRDRMVLPNFIPSRGVGGLGRTHS